MISCSACGWHVLEVPDGNYNAAAISRALEHAQDFAGKPVFLNINTVIGLGTCKAGTCHAHENPFGPEDIVKCKETWNLDPTKTHDIPTDVSRDWSQVPKRGILYRQQWEKQLVEYEHEYPDLAESLRSKIRGDLGTSWENALRAYKLRQENISLMEASAAIYNSLWPTLPFFSGSADLLEYSGFTNVEGRVFGSKLIKGMAVDFASTYVHFGIREHGMLAVANGIAAYSKRAYLPVTSTLSAFQLYGAAALRMSAICGLQGIHLATFDSIEDGALGPTHQVSLIEITLLARLFLLRMLSTEALLTS